MPPMPHGGGWRGGRDRVRSFIGVGEGLDEAGEDTTGDLQTRPQRASERRREGGGGARRNDGRRLVGHAKVRADDVAEGLLALLEGPIGLGCFLRLGTGCRGNEAAERQD